jgi:hypothetical protein
MCARLLFVLRTAPCIPERRFQNVQGKFGAIEIGCQIAESAVSYLGDPGFKSQSSELFPLGDSSLQPKDLAVQYFSLRDVFVALTASLNIRKWIV